MMKIKERKQKTENRKRNKKIEAGKYKLKQQPKGEKENLNE